MFGLEMDSGKFRRVAEQCLGLREFVARQINGRQAGHAPEDIGVAFLTLFVFEAFKGVDGKFLRQFEFADAPVQVGQVDAGPQHIRVIGPEKAFASLQQSGEKRFGLDVVAKGVADHSQFVHCVQGRVSVVAFRGLEQAEGPCQMFLGFGVGPDGVIGTPKGEAYPGFYLRFVSQFIGPGRPVVEHGLDQAGVHATGVLRIDG